MKGLSGVGESAWWLLAMLLMAGLLYFAFRSMVSGAAARREKVIRATEACVDGGGDLAKCLGEALSEHA